MRGTLVPSAKRRAHDVELALHAPHPAEHFRDVVLRGNLAAAEDRVALRIDRLIELAGRIAAAVEVFIAHHAGQAPEDEAR